ncbi:MAG: hypothetical protein M3N98_01770 [Actinomycetota bacterium]|nr:hypothetical protein [Actinomycetota bacterium]
MSQEECAALLRHWILRRELFLVPISMLVGGALAWLSISRQLRRLRSIVDLAAKTAAGEADKVQSAPGKDELSAISTSLTEIMTVLRRALHYQQRFPS